MKYLITEVLSGVLALTYFWSFEKEEEDSIKCWLWSFSCDFVFDTGSFNFQMLICLLLMMHGNWVRSVHNPIFVREQEFIVPIKFINVFSNAWKRNTQVPLEWHLYYGCNGFKTHESIIEIALLTIVLIIVIALLMTDGSETHRHLFYHKTLLWWLTS